MPYARSPRSWIRKFVDAFRGIGLGVRGQNSFLVHLPAAVVVAAAAAALRVERWEWVAVILSITAVWAAELFNSSLERLCLAVDREFNERRCFVIPMILRRNRRHVGAACAFRSGCRLSLR